jgi:glycosyltransferase involved in cell wall biosynthesis
LRNFRPDIVHTHTLTGLFIALPWTKLYRIPIVAHLHNVHDAKAHRMGLADRLITVSSAVAETMREHGVPSRKLRVVLNGNLGSPRVPKISELTPATLHHPAIVTVAGMYHRKGIAELIEAFGTVAEKIPEVHLYLVGGGPDKALFQEQAAQLPSVERIHFEDFQPAPQSYMLSADIFVLASRRDSCPLVLAEAREAGSAIIASDIDGIPEALDYGDAGILVPPRSPEHLAAAMLLLLEKPELRKSWQAKAKTDLDRFTIGRMAREIFTVYEDLLEPAKAPH